MDYFANKAYAEYFKNREYGISRAAEKIRNFLNTVLKKYLDEVIHKEYDENGSVIREELGVRRVLDHMLLEEIVQYSDSGNYDRIVARPASHSPSHENGPNYRKGER